MGKLTAIKQSLLRMDVLFVIYVLFAVGASLQLYLHGPGNPGAGAYTHYNNYVIFRQSFFHLIDGKDLYVLYPAEHWDLYKYSPAFALGFGLLAWLPDAVGLSVWNLLNALALFGSMRMLCFKERRVQLVLWFILIELLTSMQNAQSNALMAALIIGAYAWMQRGKAIWAALFIVLATFIKVYGAVGFCLFFFYPKQRIKFFTWSAVWAVIMLFIPLVVTSPETLLLQYKSWVRMMGEDAAASYGFSVMGWLHSWFGAGEGSKLFVALAGFVLFLLSLLRRRLWQDARYKVLMLASILLWIVIFNHKAESPTFIIAVSGFAVWYFSTAVTRPWQRVLLWVVFIGTCMAPTDFFPASVRKGLLVPYVIKAVPCIIAWAVIWWQTMRLVPLPSERVEEIMFQPE